MCKIVWVDDEPETSLMVEELRRYLTPVLPRSVVEWWQDAASVAALTSISDGTCFVLDHRWQGASVEAMVERIFRLNPSSRVIVCTGKSIEPSDLVRLGRLGVFTYWAKPVDMQTVGRILVDVCMSPTAALSSLRRDGMNNLLIEQAAQHGRELSSIKSQLVLLARERDALRAGTASEVRRELLGILKISVPIVLVSLSVVLVKHFTNESGWVVLGAVGLGTAASLFLDKAIEKVVVSTPDVKIDIAAKAGRPPKSTKLD